MGLLGGGIVLRWTHERKEKMKMKMKMIMILDLCH